MKTILERKEKEVALFECIYSISLVEEKQDKVMREIPCSNVQTYFTKTKNKQTSKTSHTFQAPPILRNKNNLIHRPRFWPMFLLFDNRIQLV